MQVVVPSTPAQMFHMLRRQMLRPIRKPLIVMTPKSLLRHELSVSAIEDLTRGSFSTVIGETEDIPVHAGEAGRVLQRQGVLRSAEARRKENIRDVALVRIEQLYPFPTEEYEAVLRKYVNAQRARVVSGRAAEPGRLVSDPAPSAGLRG